VTSASTPVRDIDAACRLTGALELRSGQVASAYHAARHA
jgi:hypothetical protein